MEQPRENKTPIANEFVTYRLIIRYGRIEGGGLRFQCDDLGLDFVTDNLHDTVPELVKQYRNKLEGEGKTMFAITPEVRLQTAEMAVCSLGLKG